MHKACLQHPCIHLDEPSEERLVEPATILAITLRLLHGLMGDKGCFFGVDFALAGVEVGLVGLHHFRLHEEFVAEDAGEVDGDTLFFFVVSCGGATQPVGWGGEKTYEVASNEVFPVKVSVFAVGEDREVLGKSDQAAEEEGDIGPP